MSPMRDSIYTQLQQRPYSLDELAYQYRTTPAVIKIQLHRLQSEGMKIKVSEEEVSLFLNEHHWIWPLVWWSLMIAVFIFLGVMGE